MEDVRPKILTPETLATEIINNHDEYIHDYLWSFLESNPDLVEEWQEHFDKQEMGY